MKGVKTRTAAGVLAAHLADDHFGIGINMQRFGVKRESALQGFHQRDVLGDVVILMANPFGDPDGAAGAAINDHPNAGRARVSLGSPIDISYQFGDHSSSTISKMRRERDRVKMIIGFGVDFCFILVNVQDSVQIESFVTNEIPNKRLYNKLPFPFFTAARLSVAPIVCVDIYECSVKVAFVDGRKG